MCEGLKKNQGILNAVGNKNIQCYNDTFSIRIDIENKIFLDN